MLFYLILRGLDTVEDDMTLHIEKKDKMCREFYKYLDIPGWIFTESKLTFPVARLTSRWRR